MVRPRVAGTQCFPGNAVRPATLGGRRVAEAAAPMRDSERMQPVPPSADLDKVRAGVQRVGREMIRLGGTGWIRLDLQARVLVEHDEFALHAVRPVGIHSTPADPELRTAVLDLRRGMYGPQVGAWLSVRVTADPPMQLQLNVNYNDDPLWTNLPPAAAYHRDLQVFPRPPELITGWLRARLDRSS